MPRVAKTAQLVAAEIGYQQKGIAVEERLYAAPVDDLLAVIRATDKNVDRLMLFGHNPEFSDLASHLAGEPIDMPTCAVAEFAYDGASWSDVGATAPARTALETRK